MFNKIIELIKSINYTNLFFDLYEFILLNIIMTENEQKQYIFNKYYCDIYN